MSPKPTLILVPGAWHNGAIIFNKVISVLSKQQYKCIPIALPSITPTGNPSITYIDDITAVRNAIEAETTQGRDVVLVVHSYGGHVGSSAMKGLTRPKQHQDNGNSGHGHVIGFAMISSVFTVTGAPFVDGTGKHPPWMTENLSTGFIEITVPARDVFYHDLPEDEGNEWATKLQKMSARTGKEGGEHAYAGWKDVPVWYLATKNDHALPYKLQLMFVNMARDEGGDVTVRKIESSHSPMLSRPEETAEFISEAVNAFVR